MRDKAKALATHPVTNWGAIVALAVTTYLGHVDKNAVRQNNVEGAAQKKQSNANAAAIAKIQTARESSFSLYEMKQQHQDEAIESNRQACIAATEALDESIDLLAGGRDFLARKAAGRGVVKSKARAGGSTLVGRAMRIEDIDAEDIDATMKQLKIYQRK